MDNARKPARAPRKIWSYVPDVPLKLAPFCEWPIRFNETFRYIASAWSPLSLRAFVLAVAVIVWTFFTPSLERMVSFQIDWMAEVWLRNFVMVLTVAGGLHLWLFTFAKQGNRLRFDDRPLAKKSKIFHFGNQVWDNVFWTLFGAVPVATLFECLMLWGYANGIAPYLPMAESPVWFVLLFLLLPFWSGLHFYLVHRLLHVGPLYRWVHYWHHKNVNTGPWSGHAMHPVEHVGIYSDVLAFFLIPSHPIHLQYTLFMHSLGGPISHCGFEKVMVTDKAGIEAGDFMHQLHHRFIDCNYGTLETPWDKVFGSFHDGTPEADQRIKERRRRLVMGATTEPAE